MIQKYLHLHVMCLILASAPWVAAGVVHDEAMDGDISSDSSAPTSIPLSVGSNRVLGTVTDLPYDPDFFVLTIPEGQELTAITLDTYTTTVGNSFFAVEAGQRITSEFSSASMLGTALIGSLAGSQEGEDVLDDLAEAALGGSGFMPPLGAGSYAFWFQETGGPVEYGFDFRIVPEPALSGWLGLLLLVFRGRVTR